ncbi:hypothetical protein N473_03930 [Pseudoalteromonas luteoviolacea CPMOR-1]|uniref:Uncharacterized protein n=1 Tax=Pseudoalteromonas luteoviolacea CPMOR-1 TaxID=1365248 RepID=A0A167IG37_9GAMM|nr:hypothetical protein N473_03930 [Pseudoalteromonas luteoviolacea CPMOR-1]
MFYEVICTQHTQCIIRHAFFLSDYMALLNWKVFKKYDEDKFVCLMNYALIFNMQLIFYKLKHFCLKKVLFEGEIFTHIK